MARPLRLEFEGALYHVTSRGDRQEDIFEIDSDRYRFLTILGDVCETFNWACHAYCLMGNHYHLLIETPEANLSRGMRQLNGVYTQQFNRQHKRCGHVFQGRYNAILVDSDSYLLELSRYIVLNPVRAGMVENAQDWPWSSFRATVRVEEKPDWLQIDWLLSAFGSKMSAAIDQYIKFVIEGIGRPSIWANLKNQIYLGDDLFVEKMQRHVDRNQDLREIPNPQSRLRPKSLQEYQRLNTSRDGAIAQAYRSGGYTLKEIADYFGLHYSTVSVIVKNSKSKT